MKRDAIKCVARKNWIGTWSLQRCYCWPAHQEVANLQSLTGQGLSLPKRGYVIWMNQMALTGVNILLILRIVSWSFSGWNSRGLQACFLKFKPNCSEIRIPDGVCWREECGNKWSNKLVRNSIFLVWKEDVWEVPASENHMSHSVFAAWECHPMNPHSRGTKKTVHQDDLRYYQPSQKAGRSEIQTSSHFALLGTKKWDVTMLQDRILVFFKLKLA